MEPITREEAEEIRAILKSFMGLSLVHGASIMMYYEVLGQLMTITQPCTKAMHFVPRPWDYSSPLKWVQSQVKEALIKSGRRT